MQPLVQLDNLTKHYDAVAAMDGIDLSLQSGEVLGLLGPNGAGKTTMLRLLTGVLQPTAGRVTVLGAPPQSAARAQLGYLPGELRLPPSATGRRLALLHARLRACAGPRTDELAARLELDLHRPVGSLSTGNRRKLGIVLALQHRPRVAVLDEPTSGLDPLTQRVFLELVREAAAGGAGVLFSSHVLTEVEAVADRVAILRKGRLLALERTSDLGARARQTIRLSLRRVDLARLSRADGVVQVNLVDGGVEVQVEGDPGDLLTIAAELGITHLHAPEPRLEDSFHHLYDTPRPTTTTRTAQ